MDLRDLRIRGARAGDGATGVGVEMRSRMLCSSQDWGTVMLPWMGSRASELIPADYFPDPRVCSSSARLRYGTESQIRYVPSCE